MSKRPSFQFYPGDWLRDVALRSCSISARGLWMDMICYMHQSDNYGHLKIGEKIIGIDELSRMTGIKKNEVKKLIFELKNAQVLSQNGDGVLFSKRMVRDEEVRAKRAAGGELGGNPKLLKGSAKVSSKVNLQANLLPTPSSSSSSSSSTNTPLAPQGGLDRFLEFWAVYPKKVANAAVKRYWLRHNLDKHAEQIIAAVKRYKATEKWQEQAGKFVPNPLTFLNQSRWEDEIGQPTRPPYYQPFVPQEAE